MNNLSMIKKLTLVLVFVLAISPTSSAIASPKSDKLIAEFNRFISVTQSDYEAKVSEAESKYQPLIRQAQGKIQAAISDLRSANKVKVLKLGTNRSYWGQFDCPVSRPLCIGVDKGPEFQVGETIVMKDIVLSDLDQLYVMELILKDGLVELLNPTTYLRAVENFRSAYRDLATATNDLDSAKFRATDARLTNLEYADAIRIAKLAAKRADKTPKDFNRAFSNAFIFEYNRIELNKYASTPFSQINSVKALNNVIEISKLSSQADAVASSYSFNGANKLNKLCGNVFTSEPDFKSDFSFISGLFRTVLKSSMPTKI
jgi:hypothetical protein